MSAIWEYHSVLLSGLWVTLLVFVLGITVAIATAFVAGLAALSDHWFLRWPSVVFVEVFRGTSMLVQMFWFFYVLPFFGLELSPLTAAVLAVGLNEGAYAAEIVRGTIKARPRGQTEACVALGIGKTLRMRRILIPQSIPAMLPPFGNVFVDLLKNTSLVSLVTVGDLTFGAQAVWNATGETVPVFTTLLVMYFILSMIVYYAMKWLERRFAIDRPSRPRGGFLRPRKAGAAA